jgi:hypothetical protein
MAARASASDVISTKPKPRLRPVWRSSTTWALLTSPNGANKSSRSAFVTENERLPTYNFLPTFKPPETWCATLTRVRLSGSKERGRTGRPTGQARRSRSRNARHSRGSRDCSPGSIDKPTTKSLTRPTMNWYRSWPWKTNLPGPKRGPLRAGRGRRSSSLTRYFDSRAHEGERVPLQASILP